MSQKQLLAGRYHLDHPQAGLAGGYHLDHPQAGLAGVYYLDHPQVGLAGVYYLDHLQAGLAGVYYLDHPQAGLAGVYHLDHPQTGLAGVYHLEHPQVGLDFYSKSCLQFVCPGVSVQASPLSEPPAPVVSVRPSLSLFPRPFSSYVVSIVSIGGRGGEENTCLHPLFFSQDFCIADEVIVMSFVLHI